MKTLCTALIFAILFMTPVFSFAGETSGCDRAQAHPESSSHQIEMQ